MLNWLRNRRLFVKLFIGPAVALILFLATGSLVITNSIHQQQMLRRIDLQREMVKSCSDMVFFALRAHVALNQVVSWTNIGYDQSLIDARAVQGNTALGSHRKILDELITKTDGQERTELELSKKLCSNYQEWYRKTLDMVSTDVSVASTFLTPAGKTLDSLVDNCETILSHQIKASNELSSKVHNLNKFAMINVSSFLAGAICVLVLLNWLIIRMINRPIATITRQFAQFSQGDLRSGCGISGSDEIGSIGIAMDNTIATLRSVVGEIGDNARSLSRAAGTFSDTTTQLTQIAHKTDELVTSTEKDICSTGKDLEIVSSSTNDIAHSISTILTSLEICKADWAL